MIKGVKPTATAVDQPYFQGSEGENSTDKYWDIS